MMKRYLGHVSFFWVTALLLMLLVAGAVSGSRAVAQEPSAQMQVGLWGAQKYNIEDFYVNLFHHAANAWDTKDGQGASLLAEGFVNAEGYPQKWPGSRMHQGGFFGGGSDEAKRSWDGEWLLLWGPSDCAAFSLGYANQGGVTETAPGRIAFTRDFDKNPLLGFTMQIESLDCPLTELALIRAENEDAYKAGAIWNPLLKPHLADYDMIRLMDPMSANAGLVTHPDELSPMGSLFWGDNSWRAGGLPGERKPPFESMPLEAVIRAGIAYDASLWLNTPFTLGSAKHYWEFRPADGDSKVWRSAYLDYVEANGREIINSKAWDDYADALIEAMVSEGYAADRPLYISPGNEVWNWSSQYWLGSQYAGRIGKAHSETANGTRAGYGVLVARLKLAIDGAQRRAGTDFDITVIFEGQTGITSTRNAIIGAKAWLEARGEVWADHASGFGSSPASYWGADWQDFTLTPQERSDYWRVSREERNRRKALAQERWEKLIADDPEGTAKDFADFILTNPITTLGLEFHLDNIRNLIERTEVAYGVKFVGFYEGGSHFGRPKWMDKDWYEDFIWGAEGGRVNYEVNIALAKAFPGLMLSNYILAGPVGNSPFPEGSVGADNPYALSWGRVRDALE